MRISLEEYTNQDKLNPAIFSEESIIQEARVIFLKIAESFYRELNIEVPIKDIILTGSSANYNWTKFSDIDVHLLLDFTGFKELDSWREYFTFKKNQFNNQFKLSYKGYPIEMYVQDVNEPHFSSGIYSLISNKWIDKPIYNKIEIDDQEIELKAKPLMDEIDSAKNKSSEDISALKDKIKQYRKTGLEKEGEYSIENLVFKELRNRGYIDKLYSFSNESTDDLEVNHQQVNIIKEFIKFVSQEINLKNIPAKITLSYDTKLAKANHTFGVFSSGDNSIWLYVKNRNTADILRTLAHELVHRKQAEDNRLDVNSGDTGSPIENEANALAGVLLRKYGKQHEEIYENMKNLNLLKSLINEAIDKKKNLPMEEEYNVKSIIKKIEEDAHNASKASQVQALQLEIDSINSKLAEEVLNEAPEAEMNIKKHRINRKKLQDRIAMLNGPALSPINEPVEGDVDDTAEGDVSLDEAKNPMFDKLVKKYMDKGHSLENAKKQAAADINAGSRSAEKSEKQAFNYNESKELEERKLTKSESKNKEKIVKAIKKETGADKSGEFTSKSGKTYNAFAIATAQAKKK